MKNIINKEALEEAFKAEVLQQLGLEIDINGYIIEQDSEMKLYVKGKPITNISSRYSLGFDPLSNGHLMSFLFSYYLSKLQSEEDRYITMFYSSSKERNGKGYMAVQEQGELIKSRVYNNDSIKYLDLLYQLNGLSKNLIHYDIEL